MTGVLPRRILKLTVMQLSVKSGSGRTQTLADLPVGETGVLEALDLPDDVARRLMELGFLPGHVITPSHSAPGGDPRVFRIDGSEIALRRETALSLRVRAGSAAAD